MASAEIKSQFESLENIRPFPATAARILEIAGTPDCDVKELTQLLECEPTVASKILAMANSPLFGVAREINSIAHSIVRLGFRSVAQLAVSVFSKQLFDEGDPGVADQRKRVFRQSLATATVAKLLSQKYRLASPDQAFLAGVMHDIGRLVYFDLVPETYVALLSDTPDGETTEAETKQFGIDHAQVGFECGRKWGLPSAINDAIAMHHHPIQDVPGELAKVLIVANYFARLWQVGFQLDEQLPTCAACEQIIEAAEHEEMARVCGESFTSLEQICGV